MEQPSLGKTENPMETESIPAPDSRDNIGEGGHLNKDIKPIIACVGVEGDYVDCLTMFKKPEGKNENIYNVDFYKRASLLETLLDKARLIKERLYTSSDIDNKDKFSDEFHDCLSLIVCGQEEISGENVSFMTHHDPQVALPENVAKFTKEMEDKIKKLASMCKQGTVDAVIAGGHTASGSFLFGIPNGKEKYDRSLSVTRGLVSDSLGFVPAVIEPRDYHGGDVLYFDNTNRRLFVLHSGSKQL